MSELLQEVIDSLAEAVEQEQSIRFGHEAARVLHAALLDATVNKPHQHVWQPLGYDRPGGGKAFVVSACVCGEAQEVSP